MRIYPLIFNSMLIFDISVVFSPPIFFEMLKMGDIAVDPSSICALIFAHSAVIPISSIWKKVLMSSDHTLDFTDMGKRTYPKTILVHFQKFGFIVDNHYALLWAPNAYGDILMRIFTPCLVFQCVFHDFQCLITLLHALSVALVRYFVRSTANLLSVVFQKENML